jgi:protein-S-isoprenylcysteine O-methyltransferase Ste14
MYIGAAVALSGTAVFYSSLATLAYLTAFLLVTHAFVRIDEEPTLRRTFGSMYEGYCSAVQRWLPGRPRVIPRAAGPRLVAGQPRNPDFSGAAGS